MWVSAWVGREKQASYGELHSIHYRYHIFSIVFNILFSLNKWIEIHHVNVTISKILSRRDWIWSPVVVASNIGILLRLFTQLHLHTPLFIIIIKCYIQILKQLTISFLISPLKAQHNYKYFLHLSNSYSSLFFSSHNQRNAEIKIWNLHKLFLWELLYLHWWSSHP